MYSDYSFPSPNSFKIPTFLPTKYLPFFKLRMLLFYVESNASMCINFTKRLLPSLMLMRIFSNHTYIVLLYIKYLLSF